MRALGVLVILSSMVACGGEPEMPDASADSGAREDAAVVAWARAIDCDDGLFCTVHRCMPATEDPRGCIPEDGPCGADETCDEGMDRCVAAVCGPMRDADGDGHESLFCGGGDCDDDDDQAFPGNQEVCDTARHDEDCVATTFGSNDDGDIDGDGFVSSACCNGDDCGDDCDDDDRGVFPGARETCNAIDDDCDGAVDEDSATLPLCPDGTCPAGRCSFSAWDRTFGGEGFDYSYGSAMDERGNVYLLGQFEETVGFGGTPPLTARGPADTYLASYAADGSFRWVKQYGEPGRRVLGFDVAFDTTRAQVYFAAYSSDPVDFGGGIPGGSGARAVVVALDREGDYQWEFPLPEPPAGLRPSVEGQDGVTIAGPFSNAFDFGAGMERVPGGSASGYVVRLSADGAYQWDILLVASDGGGTFPTDVANTSDGGVVVAGRFTIGTTLGTSDVITTAGGTDLFVAQFDRDGRQQWPFVLGGPGQDGADAVAVGADGTVFFSGVAQGTIDFGDPPAPLELGAEGSAFLATLSFSGAPMASRRLFTGVAQALTHRLAATSGGVLAVGQALEQPDFGGGTVALPESPHSGGFAVEFEPDLTHRSDSAFFQYTDFPAPCPTELCQVVPTGISVGPGGTTVISGYFTPSIHLDTHRVSNGAYDVFLVRLAR